MSSGTTSAAPNCLQKKITALGKKLKRRQITGSQNVALEVVRLLREVVAANRLATFELLLQHIEAVGQELQAEGPKGNELITALQSLY
jgi:translation initiation factor eIF-2B subunit beta